MKPVAALAEGRIVLDAHGAGPRIQFPPRPAVSTLLAGKAPETAASLLPALYALCGQAHRVAARLVTAAARGADATLTDAEERALADEALREHVRSVMLDWPQQVPVLDDRALAARQAALAACPLFRSACTTTDKVAWLADHVFGLPAERWHAIFESDEALAGWCERGATVPARWLAAVLADARACAQCALPPLPLEALGTWRTELCTWMLTPARPAWPGAAYETGCWHRLPRVRHAADRLVARLWEIAEHALGVRARTRAMACSPRPGCGLIYVEIARGFLLHAASLDPKGATVTAYGVMAPTDWNFAPHGAVARAIGAVVQEPDPARRDRLARVVGAAFAPCLPFDVAPA